MTKQNGRNTNKGLNVKVDYETLLKGSKVLLKEKASEAAARTVVGISKAMPEVKALVRDGVILFGTTVAKSGFEAITGIECDAVDFVEKAVHTGVAINGSYNVVTGVNNFAKGYKNATNDDINKVLKPFYEAAERYTDDEDAEEVEIIEENEEELTKEEIISKQHADTIRNLSDKAINDFAMNYSIMQDEIKKLREELAKMKENK